MLHFDEIAFGPIKSRRLGSSLGVNILPVKGKLCNFDCIYCECGWNKDGVGDKVFPRTEDVRRALSAKLKSCADAGTPIDSITFSGGQTQTINIDGVNYTVRNTQTTDNDFSYSKNLETGEITFLCSNFQITGAKDVSHDVILRGRSLRFSGGDLADKIVVEENSSEVDINGQAGDDEIITYSTGTINGNDVIDIIT